jgi:uncharacterized low-complexity protein
MNDRDIISALHPGRGDAGLEEIGLGDFGGRCGAWKNHRAPDRRNGEGKGGGETAKDRTYS